MQRMGERARVAINGRILPRMMRVYGVVVMHFFRESDLDCNVVESMTMCVVMR